MMRLRRPTVFFVAPLLLAWAGTASAECTWVRDARTDGPVSPRHRGPARADWKVMVTW